MAEAKKKRATYSASAEVNASTSNDRRRITAQRSAENEMQQKYMRVRERLFEAAHFGYEDQAEHRRKFRTRASASVQIISEDEIALVLKADLNRSVVITRAAQINTARI